MYDNQNLFETRHRRPRGMVLCIIIGSLISTSVAVRGERRFAASLGISKEHVSVEDPRPLAAAIEVLEARYGWVITYEDPRIQTGYQAYGKLLLLLRKKNFDGVDAALKSDGLWPR